MRRRNFLGTSLTPALLQAQDPEFEREFESGGTGSVSYKADVVIEKPRSGKPHKGRVLAAIQPHCDDIPIFAGGSIAKLIDEGYEAILITLSNDSMAGEGKSIGEIVLKNENDTVEMAKRLGFKETFFLNYPNHNMDTWPIVEIRARLIYIFRLMKIDTVFVYDPSQLYERNPDHYTTARAVEAACWMSASSWDYPEHLKGGLKTQSIRDKYYFARGPQIVNHVVDITAQFEKKVYANMANVTQGPAGNLGAELKAKLAKQGKKLPLLGNDDDTANRQYTRHFALSRDRVRGKAHGLQYAEFFHHIGPDDDPVSSYVGRHAVSL